MYQTLKSEYDRLKSYLDLQKKDEDKDNESRKAWWTIKSKIKEEEHAAILKMNKLQQIKSIFSKPEYLSAAHEEAKNRLDQLNSQHISHKLNKYPEEIANRKKIYHELKVLSEIRTKIRDKRVRSLANAKINKVRSTSSSTKRKLVSKSPKIIACTYCERVHETASMVMDHIYPIAKGGLDMPENAVLVCVECNTKKSDKTVMVFCTQMKFDYLKVAEKLSKMGKDV